MSFYYHKIKLQNLQKLKNKTLLITGSTGLIGSNLIAFLIFLNKKHKLGLKIIGIHQSPLEKWMAQEKAVKYLKINLTRKKLSGLITLSMPQLMPNQKNF